MAEFYIKNNDGEYVEADDKVEERFREKSDKIISSKLSKAREKETEKIRSEIEEEVRKETSETIRSEVKSELESEWKSKLDKAEAKSKQLDVDLRRKTIAAEYGFKPELEKYLGNGTDEEMRKEADTLKDNLGINKTSSAPEKKTSSGSQSSFVKLTAED